MHDNMPILLLFDAAPEFVLTAAGLEEAIGSKGSVQELSGGGIRKLEIISDGLSFFISYHGAEKLLRGLVTAISAMFLQNNLHTDFPLLALPMVVISLVESIQRQ